MHDAYLILTFFLIHVGLGRKISIPYWLAFGEDVYVVIGIAIFLDIVQIPVLEYLIAHATERLSPFLKKIKEKTPDIEHSRLVMWAKKVGPIGTIVITAMPLQGGGMWSGILLAHVFDLSRHIKYLFLSIGSVIGCTLIGVGANQLFSYF